MTPKLIDNGLRTTLLLGVILSLSAWGLASATAALSVAAGSVLALFNGASFRWTLQRLNAGQAHSRGALMSLSILKLGILFFLCWLLVVRLGLNPIGLVIGLSTFTLSIVVLGLIATTPASWQRGRDASASAWKEGG